jgi:hypothetical protein
VALGVQRDVPDKRGFLGRGSGAWQDSPAQPSHNARFASHAGPSGHVGPRRADGFGSRVGAFMPDGGDLFSGWLAGVPENGAACESKPLLCAGLVCTPCATPARSLSMLWPSRVRGAAFFRDLCRPGETRAVAWRAAGRRKAGGLPGAAEVGLMLGAA